MLHWVHILGCRHLLLLLLALLLLRIWHAIGRSDGDGCCCKLLLLMRGHLYRCGVCLVRRREHHQLDILLESGALEGQGRLMSGRDDLKQGC